MIKKTSPLELVHSDIFRPMEVTSFGGANYFVSFIDDSNRKVWVYMMNRKSEGFLQNSKFSKLWLKIKLDIE